MSRDRGTNTALGLWPLYPQRPRNCYPFQSDPALTEDLACRVFAVQVSRARGDPIFVKPGRANRLQSTSHKQPTRRSRTI
ncbi:hypothetical protein VTK26DRAFT_2221 [Humicola hyalothermophila]